MSPGQTEGKSLLHKWEGREAHSHSRPACRARQPAGSAVAAFETLAMPAYPPPQLPTEDPPRPRFRLPLPPSPSASSPPASLSPHPTTPTSNQHSMDAAALGPAPETVPPESWVRDAAVTRGELCRLDFGALRRKHHCRLCGHIFCAPCSDFWSPGPSGGAVERRCRPCYGGARAAREGRGRGEGGRRGRGHEAQQGALARRQARLARVEAAVQDSVRQFAHVPDIGRAAAEKSYYLCCRRAADAQEVLLLLVTPRRRNLRMDEEMLGLHHPFVMPVLDLVFVPEDGGAEGAGVGPPTASLGMFRSVAAWGSLRDVLHSSADPALPADAKRPLTSGEWDYQRQKGAYCGASRACSGRQRTWAPLTDKRTRFRGRDLPE
eukprot:COSAG04_NODE_453_length_14110_cov_262.397473_8_plen_378_part_00